MSTWSIPRTAAYAGLIVIAAQAFLLATGNRGVLHGVLFDPDCYMHLQRALRLMTEGHWHDTLDPRINAPYGYTIHWTALFDLLLAAGAYPLKWLGLDTHTALYVWGSAISPLLLIAALAIFAWGVRPRAGGIAFLWLTILAFTQQQFIGSFIAGRPDHHSLVLGLMLAQIAWVCALFDGRTGPRWAVAAGVMAGLQLATSVEALLTILLVSASISGAWLFYGKRKLPALVLYLGAAVLTALAWLFWEKGHFLVIPAYDRLSVVHIVVLSSGALAIAAVALADLRGVLAGTARQLAALAGALVFATGVTLACYPDFFLGPWPHLDPVMIAWHREISELRPLIPHDVPSLARFLAQLTAPILSLPLIVVRLRHGPDADRPVMLLSLAGILLFGGLALMQIRWSGEVQAVALLPWTLTTIAIMRSEWAIRIGRTRLPVRAFVLSGAILLQVVPLFITASGGDAKLAATQPSRSCNWQNATAVLKASVPAGRIIMAPVWHGPAILWHSDLRVIAGPYEIPPAIRDTTAFFRGSEAAAREVVQRRGISYALVCSIESGSSFGGALATGVHPVWLRPIPFQDGPKEFRLYEVVR
jgi:hypothetical protein